MSSELSIRSAKTDHLIFTPFPGLKNPDKRKEIKLPKKAKSFSDKFSNMTRRKESIMLVYSSSHWLRSSKFSKKKKILSIQNSVDIETEPIWVSYNKLNPESMILQYSIHRSTKHHNSSRTKVHRPAHNRMMMTWISISITSNPITSRVLSENRQSSSLPSKSPEKCWIITINLERKKESITKISKKFILWEWDTYSWNSSNRIWCTILIALHSRNLKLSFPIFS